MVRHSNSFFISVLVHGVIIGVLFYSYKYVATAFSETKAEKTVCIKLCCVVESEVPKSQEVKKKQVQEKPKNKPLKKVQKEKKKEVVPVEKKPLTIEEESLVEEVTQEILEVAPVSELAIEETEATEAVESAQTKKETPQEKYVDENIQKIIELLQDNLYYPRQARKRGIEGEVLVSFYLSVNADISRVKVISAESAILSRAAIETIENLSGKFPAPIENLTLTIPITYSLKEVD